MDFNRCEIIDESVTDITIKLKFQQLHYINEFIKLKCAPDLLKQGLFPNIKKISESMSAFNAIRRYIEVENFSKSWTLLDVACGHAPRTAALFAYRTNWNCHAIDPLLRKNKYHVCNKRLTLWDCIIEEIEPINGDVVVVTAIHAHVKLQNILQKINADRIIMVAMPCCKPLDFPNYEPRYEFEDMGCLSPKRTVKLYDIR